MRGSIVQDSLIIRTFNVGGVIKEKSVPLREPAICATVDDAQLANLLVRNCEVVAILEVIALKDIHNSLLEIESH